MPGRKELAMRLFDSHAHYLDARFDPDRPEVLAALRQAGVEKVLEVACAPADFQPALSLCGANPGFFYAALGVHPHEADQWSPGVGEELARLFRSHPQALALGEVGLDYHYDFHPRALQREAFDQQLSLAEELGLPVVLHIREAYGDAMDILRAHRQKLRGIMHCFSGSPEIARECLGLGLYIAFGGAVTFRNARKVVESAAAVPPERLLIETDCPYMAPEPHRGERNDSRFLPLILQKLAQIQGLEPEALAEITFQNARDALGLAGPKSA